jgi:1-acyl-sn-glycerol-3-phosphate acyltransferase
VLVTDTQRTSATPAFRRSPLQTALRLLRSLAAYLIVSLYVLVIAPIAMLLALLVRRDGALYVPGRFGVHLALALVGIRYRVAGRDQVPSGRGVVFCSNHQSNIDPPVLFLALHDRLRMLYKVEFDRLPILSHAIRLAGFMPIDRRDRAQAFGCLERAAATIRDGRSFLIFAEGTRSRTGELLPFKKGGFVMAILAQAPILPVAITGARQAMQKGSAIINPVQVSVRIGQPIETRGLASSDRDALMREVRARIEGLLAEGS